MIAFTYTDAAKFSYSIILKDPEFGDSTIRRLGNSFEVAMDGTNWGKISPITKRFVLKFVDLSRKTILELRKFLVRVKENRIVSYYDISGVKWNGKIIDPKHLLETIGTGPGDALSRKESNTITLTFEGSNA